MGKGSSNWLKVPSIPRASHVAHSKESAWNVRESDLILELERFPRGEHGNPLQCSCLENSMNRGAWRATSARGLQRVRHDRTTNAFTFLQVLSLKIVLEDNYSWISPVFVSHVTAICKSYEEDTCSLSF